MGQLSYLIDSNSVIDYLNGKLPSAGMSFINDILQLSVITKIEVLGFNTQTPQVHQLLLDFIDSAIIFSLEDTIVDKTIELRKAMRIKLTDAIIAATALVYDLTLITRNTNDFKGIAGLKTVNPHELYLH